MFVYFFKKKAIYSNNHNNKLNLLNLNSNNLCFFFLFIKMINTFAEIHYQY
ncbi:hypothetical protein TDCHD05_30081 [Tenacibaculum dicentrarchi]|nr:hypothetical protein TDCHD05_30081 [Tenacibaculum dicentrarchi]